MVYDPHKDFYRQKEDASSPGSIAWDVDPSDAEDLSPQYAKYLYVGGAGDVALLPAENSSEVPVIFRNVPDGGLVLLRVRRVFLTGTTATDIVAVAG